MSGPAERTARHPQAWDAALGGDRSGSLTLSRYIQVADRSVPAHEQGPASGPLPDAGPDARRSDEGRRSPLAWLLLQLITLYRATGSLRAPRCRFHPTCSTYAVVAIRQHGALRGSWLAIRRLGRCHPWNPGGVDHVPPRK